uniref:Granulin n=1 Tax=Poecilia formosa TaxID=48698 RepID=A0A087XWW0_POEFO
QMQTWVVICWAVFAVVGADECPDGGRCAEGQTCCSSPTNGYGCCPFDQVVRYSIVKILLKSKCYSNQSRCPAEFSCLKALTKFGCCPLAKGISCSDGKHCCPEGHHCSIDSRSCIKKELVTAIRCSDGVSECPDETTCCETPEGKWGCCPMPKAVCCDDKKHCCPEGTTCNIEQMKCISMSTKKELPMWAKFPARQRADWENQNVNNVPCDDTAACPDGTTCCKTKEGGWACCPMPEAVCCEDFIHCCPNGKKCDLAAGTCDDGPGVDVQVKNVPCDDTAACPDGSTCCKNKEGAWACCPLPKAVCCDDHEHCCPEGTTCNPTSTGCLQASASTPFMLQVAAFTTPVPTTQCDEHTSCPQDTTCCFIESCKKWGCCPLPKAVCCADGSHCCPENYKCNEDKTTCIRGEVEIPWYTKLPAITRVQVDPNNVQCDDDHQCPEHTSCCKLFTGEWGCCPLQNAVCCSDKEHCCPEGYTCDVVSNSCQKLILLQLETLPLIPVYLPEYHLELAPLKHRVVQCDEQKSCPDDNTCCRTSATTWGCCPAPHAVCCSDMKHCCPAGYTCTEEGSCVQNSGLNWQTWNMFSTNKKRALIL